MVEFVLFVRLDCVSRWKSVLKWVNILFLMVRPFYWNKEKRLTIVEVVRGEEKTRQEIRSFRKWKRGRGRGDAQRVWFHASHLLTYNHIQQWYVIVLTL